MSRPETQIDWKMVDELLSCGCPGTEVAAAIGIHPDTFYKLVYKKFNMGFSEYSAQKKATGEAFIRLTQYKKAVGLSSKGDNTLLIWLGKQRLGQKENLPETIANDEINKKFIEMMSVISNYQSSSIKDCSSQSLQSNS